jgi:hypothetical protein
VGRESAPEDSAIGREASPESSVLTTRSVVLRLCRLFVSTELVSPTVVVPRDGAHLSSVSRGRTTSTTGPLMRRMPARTASKVPWRFRKTPAVALEEMRREEEGDSDDDGNYPLSIHGQEGRWNAVRVCGILGSAVGHSSKGISSRDQMGPPSMKW